MRLRLQITFVAVLAASLAAGGVWLFDVDATGPAKHNKKREPGPTTLVLVDEVAFTELRLAMHAIGSRSRRAHVSTEIGIPAGFSRLRQVGAVCR